MVQPTEELSSLTKISCTALIKLTSDTFARQAPKSVYVLIIQPYT